VNAKLPVHTSNQDLTSPEKDLSISNWGPYSKEFIGLSHIVDDGKGNLMNFFVCPYLEGGKQVIPVVRAMADYHIWRAHKDLRYYSYRYELEWKDKIYTNIEFMEVDNDSRLIKVSLVNNTRLPQKMGINLVSFLELNGEASSGNTNNKFAIRYQQNKGISIYSPIIKKYYGILLDKERKPAGNWSFNITVRNVYDSDIVRYLNDLYFANLWKEDFKGDKKRHYVIYSSEPVFVTPKSKEIIYIAIATGNSCKVVNKTKSIFKKTLYLEEKSYKLMKREGYQTISDKYSFSQKMMMANIVSLVHYPQDLNGKYIRTYTAGKCWQLGFYTWDAGFHGLGLLEYSPENAKQLMDQYFTYDNKRKLPFILEGTPLFTQINLWWEIYLKTGDIKILTSFFDSACKAYELYSGKSPGSKFARFKCGLLTGFDYFYNSGGWDDYPPQNYVHNHKLEKEISPCITTSHAIRYAKTLRLVAFILNKPDIIKRLTEDIKYFENALDKIAWDNKTGYYSYYNHRTNTPLYYNQDHNYNMGLDGVSPLLSDTPDRKTVKILFKHLKNPEELWTDFGITAVSQNAPYYIKNGYWVGRVWLPHQWFIWKAAIGYGYFAFARRIAFTALDLWEKEVKRTYNLYETFFADTGTGAGCRQFGALSSPVVNFYNAYFSPGRITSGFDTVIKNIKIEKEPPYLISFTACAPFRKGTTSIIVSTGKYEKYEIKYNDKKILKKALRCGAIELRLNLSEMETKVEIRKV